MRRAHPVAAAHRRVLRPGGQGQRAVLRPQAGERDAVDGGAVDLRPAHQPALHAETNPLTRARLDDFVFCYRADDRTQRVESERFRRFTYDELTQRDKANLDIFWLRDESLEDSENLPPPDVIAEEIMEDLRAALEQLEEIAADLGAEEDPS